MGLFPNISCTVEVACTMKDCKCDSGGCGHDARFK